eukprot:Gregarina_sp_Poly_1__2590@NODE_1702_length_3512_cov_284_243251_g1115_i0_p3_GENE_NODE_1702_length_3512_cov_284_243251_g1115_i0NODE_1702_length_3512_cov_284_243251_g1115_i0_p3_ORF_typecomplete_len114_score10_64Zip/PF02535_22/9e05_NODE_1702_length_3512_cov_284_243251_g1115_i0185526
MNVGEAYCNGAYLLICSGYLVMLAVEAFATTTSRKQRVKRGLLNTQNVTNEDRRNAAILDASVASLALTFHAFFEGLLFLHFHCHALSCVRHGHRNAAHRCLSLGCNDFSSGP